MSSPEIILNEVISQVLLLDKTQIHDEISRKELEEWDSLSHLMLVSEIEAVFKIMINDDDIMNIQTIGDIKKILQELGITV